MVKFYFYANKTNVKEYSVRLIQLVMADYMVSDVSLADYVMVSICDITEISDIEKARKLTGLPCLVGGMISEFPIVNELSDYVYHGEIYGLRKHLDAGGSLDDCDYITTKSKKKLMLYQTIEWDNNPIIKVGNRAMYYYVSKGCPVQCKYCLIGNVREYQTIPKWLYKKAVSQCGKNLMPIAAYNPYGMPTSAAIGETLLKKYIAGTGGGKSARMIRSGVEFVTPELSTSLAKGVDIDDVNMAINISKANKTKMILYFIAGLEDQNTVNEFFSKLSTDYATTPVITIVFTYIDPQPMTPFYDFDLRQKIEIDAKDVFNVASQVNKRIRIMPLANIKKSTIRTMISRCVCRDDYLRVLSLRKYDNNTILSSCEQYLIGSASIKEIVHRDRGMIIHRYWNA